MTSYAPPVEAGRVVDPVTGLVFVELSHPWDAEAPSFPGHPAPTIQRSISHATQGVMTHRITTVMHTGTHVNAPAHLVSTGARVGEIPLERFFGPGVVLSVPKGEWELIEAEDLARAGTVEPGDVVVIDTGWHDRYSDSQEYFGLAPGLSRGAAEWLVERGVRLVAVDMPSVDHPLATSLGGHRDGPLIPFLPALYTERTGRRPADDFPDWNPAHRTLLAAGIPTIENVGGDVATLHGARCAFQAAPWRWPEGDASQVRFVAILDPGESYRLEPGDGEGALQLFDLSQRWGSGVPDWPSRGGHGVAVRRLQSHATDGLYTAQWEGIMHRGTHMDAPLHVLANQPSIVDYPLWRFFGTGVVVSIPKGKWEVITPADLEAARPEIREHDIVIVNTGSHANWGDSEDYFGYSPGLYKEAAEWFVERNVKLVGVDVQALDHPLGTKLVAHGPGPTLPHLMDEYRAETGRDVMDDFPHWEPAHKIMMTNGIPGIENIGGDIDAITGQRCTFMIFPWRWPGGDGSGVRVVAVVDPDQSFRIERGER